MKRKLIPLVLAVLAGGISASAESFNVEEDGVKYTIDTSDEYNYAYVTGMTDRTRKDLVIAESINFEDVDYPVRLIKMSSFWGCSDLESVTLPSSLRWIDRSAFSGTGLVSVTIPEGVESIGNSAFANCKNLESVEMLGGGDLDNFVFGSCDKLTSITLPANIGIVSPLAFRGSNNLTEINVSEESGLYSSSDGILYSKDGKELLIYPGGKDLEAEIPEGVTAVGPQAFYQSPIQWVEMPTSLLTIGKEAFYGCNGMDELVIGENVKEIGQNAFTNCGQLLSVELNTNLETLGAAAFSMCGKLKTFIVPDNVVEMGNSVFQSCYGLESVEIGKGITTLPYGTFDFCSALKEVKLSDNLHVVSSNAFSSCSGLESLTLPNSVETVEETAFWGCRSLKEIYFGTGIKTIGELAFLSVMTLTDVHVAASEPPTAFDNTFANYAATLHVPADKVEEYQNAAVWSKFSTIEAETETSVGTLDAEMTGDALHVYRIDGTALNVTDAAGLDALPSGLYIVNDGKKTVKIMK